MEMNNEASILYSDAEEGVLQTDTRKGLEETRDKTDEESKSAS